MLGLTRADGQYIGAPTGTTLIKSGGILVIYGREEGISALDRRREQSATRPTVTRYDGMNAWNETNTPPVKPPIARMPRDGGELLSGRVPPAVPGSAAVPDLPTTIGFAN